MSSCAFIRSSSEASRSCWSVIAMTDMMPHATRRACSTLASAGWMVLQLQITLNSVHFRGPDEREVPTRGRTRGSAAAAADRADGPRNRSARKKNPNHDGRIVTSLTLASTLYANTVDNLLNAACTGEKAPASEASTCLSSLD